MDEKSTKSMLESILNSEEIIELQGFLNKPKLVEAVKKVLLYPIMYQGVLRPGETPEPGKNFLLQLVASQMKRQGMINNEALGADLSGKYEGMTAVMSAFEEMKSLKVEKVVEEHKKNKAR
jgi:hypothetical protein